MALKEITDLTEKLTVNSTDFLHVKQGSEDVRVRPSVLFDLHKLEDNPHSITKTTVGLGNVTDDAQLKIASNLSDLASASTARTNLNVYSTTEVDTAISNHSSRTDNPHSVTKTQVGLGNVQNYPISHDSDENVQTKYASIAAVNDVQEQVYDLVAGQVPSGAVIMWPSNSAIPSGWVMMDGLNGTIDMRGKFVRGGDLFTVGDEGGSDTETHTHTGTVAGHVLTKDEMPEHTHGLEGRLLGGSGDTEGSSGRYSSGFEQGEEDTKIKPAGGNQPHDHGLTIDTSPSVNNLPTYYTFIFIQKL